MLKLGLLFMRQGMLLIKGALPAGMQGALLDSSHALAHRCMVAQLENTASLVDKILTSKAYISCPFSCTSFSL